MATRVEVIFDGIDRISGSVQNIERGFGRLGIAARRLAIQLAAAYSVKEAVEAADTYRLIQNRLALVTDSASNLADVQERLFRLSQQTRGSFESTVELYSRIARSTEALGVSQERLINITRTINQAVQVSGATATEASAGLIQFAQGLASGALRGDELRSVLEQMPRLAQALAEGLGVTIGQLRDLGTEGKLTAEGVLAALEDQSDVIQEEFSQMEATVGQSLTVLGNSMVNFIGRIDEATGFTDALGAAIRNLAGALDELGVSDPADNLAELVDVEKELAEARIAAAAEQADESGVRHGRRNLNSAQERVDRLLSEQDDLIAILSQYDPEDLIARVNEEFDRRNSNIRGRARTEGAVRRVENLRQEVLSLIERRADELTAPSLEDLKEIVVPATYRQRADELMKDLEDRLDEDRDRVQAIVDSLKTDNEKTLEQWDEIMSFYERGLLDEETVKRFTAQVLQPVEVTAERISQKTKETTEELSVFAEQAARNIQDIFADWLFDPFDKGLDGMLQGFIDVIRRMAAQAATARIFDTLFSSSDSKQGSGDGFAQLIGTAISSFFGGNVAASSGSTGAGLATGGYTTPGVVHPINENEPEFLITSDRSQVVPLSQAAAQGIKGGGGSVFAPNTTLNVMSEALSREELAYVLEQNNRQMLAMFERRMRNGEIR